MTEMVEYLTHPTQDYIPDSHMTLSCPSCKIQKGFTQLSQRRVVFGPYSMNLVAVPSYWPGRHRGLCFECGQEEHIAKTGSMYFSTRRDQQVYEARMKALAAEAAEGDSEE